MRQRLVARKRRAPQVRHAAELLRGAQQQAVGADLVGWLFEGLAAQSIYQAGTLYKLAYATLTRHARLRLL